MRVHVGELVSIKESYRPQSGSRWIYVTDAAEEPESILSGNYVEILKFVWLDTPSGGSAGIHVRLLPLRVTSDDSLVSNRYPYPFSVEPESMVEYSHGPVQI